MNKWLFTALVVLGILSAAILAYPPVLIYGFFLFGFLGLGTGGMVLWVVPAIVLYLIVILGIRFLLRRLGPLIAWIGACAAALALAFLAPLAANKNVRAFTDKMTAGDRSLAEPLGKPRVLAYLNPKYVWKRHEGPEDCSEVCQRLLYDGTVDEVLMGASSPDLAAPLPQELARYRIERRQTCPHVSIPNAGAWQWEDRPARHSGSIVSDRVKARIAAGECLIREEGKLSDADVVVVDRDMYKAAGARPDPVDGVVDARRIGVYQPAGATLSEVFRRTEVKSKLVRTPFLFGPFGGGGLNVKAGVATKKEVVGAYDVGKVLADDLKLDVGIPAEVARADVRDLLRAAIADGSRSADDPMFDLSDQILRQIGAEGPRGPDDIALLEAMITDARVRKLFSLSRAVWRLGPDGAVLAGPLLDRLLASDPKADEGVVSATTNSIILLPDGALFPVMDKLRQLAADKVRRVRASRALGRLADGGPENVALLLDLLRFGWNADRKRDGWYVPDIAIGALIGLCRLGPEARSAAPTIVELLNASELQGGHLSGRGGLAVQTLRRLGPLEVVAADLNVPDSMQEKFARMQRQPVPASLDRACRY